jgi:hypothetical protein
MRRPQIRMAVGIAAGIAAFAATAVLALTRNGAAMPAAAGPLGPEQVPIPAAVSLGRVRLVAAGQQIDGIACDVSERVRFHIHAHLTIFVGGAPRQVPAGIGLGAPYDIVRTRSGAFVTGATCFMWLHTHAADGIIHTESPIDRTYTLGEFFDIGGQRLDRDHVGPARGTVTALVDGRVFTGDPRRIPLLAHAQIQLEVGRPVVAAEHIAFPKGL